MWMMLERINHGKASALGAVTGMVAGLVQLRPHLVVGPGGGLIIGLLAGGVLQHRLHQTHTEN